MAIGTYKDFGQHFIKFVVELCINNVIFMPLASHFYTFNSN